MNDRINNILSSTRYATISTVDVNGKPWAAPVWYVADDKLNIYWWSPLAAQHSQNITAHANVYITIFDSSLAEGDGEGLYLQCRAAVVGDNELEAVMALYNLSTTKFKLSRDNCLADAPTRLYKATPEKIWINDGLERAGYYVDIRRELTNDSTE